MAAVLHTAEKPEKASMSARLMFGSSSGAIPSRVKSVNNNFLPLLSPCNLNTILLIATKSLQPFFKMKFQTRPCEGSRSIDVSVHCGGDKSRLHSDDNDAHFKQKLQNNLELRMRRFDFDDDTTRLAAPARCHYLLFTDRKW